MSSEVKAFQYHNKSGKFWGYRFEIAPIDNVRKWSSGRGYKTKADAIKAGRDAQIIYENKGEVVTPSEMSYADFLDKWLTSLEGNLKSTTVLNYRKKIDLYIKPYIGGFRLKAIRKADIRELLKKLSENGCATKANGLSRNTLTVIKGIFTKSFNFAVDERYLPENPINGYLRLPKEDDLNAVRNPALTNPHVYIPQEQIDAIFKRFPENSSDHIALMFGYKCGLRIGEAFAVCWEDIDFEKRTLTVNRQVQWHQDRDKPKEKRDSHNRREARSDDSETGFWYFSKPKYNSMRTIELDDSMLDLLQREKEQQERDKPYYEDFYYYYYKDFRGRIYKRQGGLLELGDLEPVNLVNVRRDGEFINPRTIQHVSNVIHHQLNYPQFDFHSLRHTHATMLAERGASPMYVRNRLGHKNMDVTLRVYYHYTDMMSKQGTDILNGMYSK